MSLQSKRDERCAPELPAPDELAAAALLDAGGPVRVQGKFFFAGDGKHFVKGVTYGPFAPGSHGAQFPERATVERDFALMRGAGVNTVRVFTVPPVWLLDAAGEAGLKVLVGLPWTQHVAFLDSADDQDRDPRRGHGRGARLRPPSGGLRLSRRQRDPARHGPLARRRARCASS